MTPHGHGAHDVPRDLAEAFDAFIQQTQVPEDFYAGVRARMPQPPVRRARWGEWTRGGTWVRPAWSPLGVWAVTVAGLLSLALNVGLGYEAWYQRHVITRLGHELSAAQAQLRAVYAEQQAWQARHAALTDQLAALHAQTQQAAQDNAALRQQVAAAQEQLRQAHAENQAWQARYAELITTLAAPQKQEPRAAQHEPLVEPGTNVGRRSYTVAELVEALFPVPTRGLAPPPATVSVPVVLPLTFAPRSSAIQPQYEKDLDILGQVLTLPQYMSYRIDIGGHTDSVEAQEVRSTGQAIGLARAAVVRQYLLEHFAIPSERLRIHGYGASQPLATNATPEGRSLNRRVDIVASQQ